MQFVKSGPDIPEQLLHAHEDGQVVFFCGAGISIPAGLPTFAGLVDQLFVNIGVTRNPVEVTAKKAKQHDIEVGLLEGRVRGGRQTVRRALAQILTPDLNRKNATATHEALLTLGRNRKGNTRLITTNFDRLFEEAIARRKCLDVEHYRAPLLPVPKKRWDGLVYLHGLLTDDPSENDLESLVVSSGDFGLAYLSERWAARFVSDLLQNFAVCFVGYGINDPVLRYMMDALAADRLLGESPPEMFAFGSFSKGKRESVEREWRAKNVTPILYQEHWRHAYLHRTLKAWSETYRDGVRGKEQIIVTHAGARPQASTKQDNFVDRVIWALSDPSGLPAKCFAELDPVPSIEWLEPLSEKRFRHADLMRFGVSPNRAMDKALEFSLVQRPSPYKLALRMALVSRGTETTGWDNVMEQIARWLTRHLDDPAPLLWLAKHGGAVHDRLVYLIERKLTEISRLEQHNDQATLQKISANAPNAIPRSRMRTLWRLLLKGHVQAWQDDHDFFRWCVQFQHDGLTVPLRLDLREKLMPRVVLREPFDWSFEDEKEADPERMSRLVEAEIVLSTQDAWSQLQEIRTEENWAEALPDLLGEFTGLLKDALDLMSELEKANERRDPSWFQRPSISAHSQNSNFQDWTILIELVRDSWLAMCAQSPKQARAAAEAWLSIPYPVFRRLAFFAAAQDGIIPRQDALDWLLSDECWWLWDPDMKREAIRLLVCLAPGLDVTELERLEAAILAGPPRRMFREDMVQEDWNPIRHQYIWLRLAKLAATGANLGAAGTEKLKEISALYPDWGLAEDERDEFPTWWTSVSHEHENIVPTPHDLPALVEWLKAHPAYDPWREDDWPNRCRDNFDTASDALSELATQDIWPGSRWNQALNAWKDEDLIQQSWDKMAPILDRAPNTELQKFSRGVSDWLSKLAWKLEGQEATFLALCDRLLDLEYKEKEEVDDPVGIAINHAVGQTTKALLQWWWRGSPEDCQELSEALKSRFSKICGTWEGKFRHGRVLLAAQVIALFRVDPDWTKQFLLPLFEWERAEVEAQAAWKGFLWSPRLHAPLMEAFKPAFLDTANHYDKLGRHGAQYTSLLTFAALDPGGVFSRHELAKATKALPQAGLNEVTETLSRALQGAGDQRLEYWRNRVQPYLKNIWPKTQDAATTSVAKNFALMCVAAGDAFPAAFEAVFIWLQPLEYPDQVVHRLHESNMHEQFPIESLKLLDAIIGKNTRFAPHDLAECLRTIRTEMPELEADDRFKRLAEFNRRIG